MSELEELMEEIMFVLNDRLLIPTHHTKSDMEELIGRSISEDEWREVIRRWNTHGWLDSVTEQMVEFVRQEIDRKP